MPIEQTILKAVARLKRDALQLRETARREQLAVSSPVINGALRRTEQVSTDFAHGIESALQQWQH